MAHPGTSMLWTGQERKECLNPVPREQPVIVYCNSGLNVPLVGLSLLAAGGEGKVYDGGLEEWLSGRHAPVEHRTTPV